VRQWAQRLDDLQENLYAAAHNSVQSRQHGLRLLRTRLDARHPTRELERRRSHLAQLFARLRALGPQATLDRGYALVLDQRRHPLSRADGTSEGQAVRIVLSKGIVGATLNRPEPEKTLIDALIPDNAAEIPAAPKKRKPRKKSA
jgi:exonuclease VII large subunit